MPNASTKGTDPNGLRAGSIKGALLGSILLLISLGLFYAYEGTPGISTVAKQAISINASAPNPSLDGSIVAASGIVHAKPQGDGLFLKPGPYLNIQREIKVYEWVETQKSRTIKNADGSETTTSTYSYDKAWTEAPKETGAFIHPEGHQNPSSYINADDFSASSSTLGVYSLDMSLLRLPAEQRLSLNTDNTLLTATSQTMIVDSKYLFVPAHAGDTPASPQVGDEEIFYSTLPTNVPMLVFGQLLGGKIVPYSISVHTLLYQNFYTDKDTAVAQLRSEQSSVGWIIPLMGFLLMWLSLILLIHPYGTLSDPIHKKNMIGHARTSLVTLGLAGIFSFIAYIVTTTLHNFIAVAVITTLQLVFVIVLVKRIQTRSKSMTMQK